MAELRDDVQKTVANEDCRKYFEYMKQALENPEEFWAAQATQFLDWFKPWTQVLTFDSDEARISWFTDGKLNAYTNCIARHSRKHPEKTAFYCEFADPHLAFGITYAELGNRVDNLAATLTGNGIRPDDRVIIHLTNSIELVVSMLACAKIGAVFCVVYSGYGRESLAYRANTIGCAALITSYFYHSKDQHLSMIPKIEYCKNHIPSLRQVFIFPNSDEPTSSFGFVIHSNGVAQFGDSPASPRESEDPLFITFAAPAIGKPRPLVHTHGGYLLWAAMVTKFMFQVSDNDIFWCTSDLSRICGHTLSVFGSLLNAGTGIIHHGDPSELKYSTLASIIEKRGVTNLCTGGSVIRSLKASFPNNGAKFAHLRLIAAAGESLRPDEREWLFEYVGDSRLPIISTWGQAETGGPLMSTSLCLEAAEPGSVGIPFFGIKPLIFDLNTGEPTQYPNQEGALFIETPWPSIARTIFENHDDFREAYFMPLPGVFLTGEGAKIDEKGFYWVLGRIDDVINVAGHRLGAWELETALSSHDAVAEVTAVGYPHETKGQGIYAFIKPISDSLDKQIVQAEIERIVDQTIGHMAVPDVVQWTNELPKTRGGKILRRVLQKIAAGENIGDLSTVANPEAVKALLEKKPE